MAAREDRRDYIERHLRELGLVGERVEAITPADFDATAEGGRLAAREVACSLSHMRAWRTDGWTLVLEDDAVLSRRLPRFLEAFANAPPTADLIQMQAHLMRRTRVFPPVAQLAGVDLRPFRSNHFGAACYLISPNGARYLAEKGDPRLLPIDGILFDKSKEPARSLRSLVADPALALQLEHVDPARPEARSDVVEERNARGIKGFRIDPANALDHLRHLPQGIRRKWIRFADDDTKAGQRP